MLAKRIIPVILHKHGQMVKGRGFKANRIIGQALQAASIQAEREVDELLILDVTATTEGREPDYDLVRKLSKEYFCPLTVGGGITKDEHVRGLLNAGADKVCIGSAAIATPHLITRLAEKYGSSTIAVSLDVAKPHPDASASIVTFTFSDGKRTGDLSLSPVGQAQELQRLGAGEILLQAVDRDGTMQGYDLDLIRAVTQAVRIPVVASGGCGSYQHMKEAIEAGADAVAAGALWSFTDCTPSGAAKYLAEHNIEVRRI